ncbi:uncharacterized protein Nmag_3144 [Natrialba magadii ATCC 43099]|uniref:Type I restriction enzyme R protein N-terminal domain-containing protein n=1 Tax=Natrialba magadii (strain ATCC 43099 / DSM 3394 / CCM 3739 / CIP 104546 / IAM 13178 / JCM 8861 / NBRC 102185 / NCIMB 2190 / MS3) TaxID=547559 RepID=D3SRS2_NATMM|nr:hypothetical protein [Natrialba magadii]ADD06696.1 uncharacterized protein Nmag_3144 [Natrialba magadii ATCC 43099]ELY31843.1 hypothetical protein C500_04678 [Natrialba magadii ATCC 43099]
MTGAALRTFVARSRSVVESAPPAVRPATRTWFVDPFLETLGWDVHADSCTAETTVDDTALEYVFAVDDVPALLVAVEPATETLETDRARSLLEAMTWSGIDRALYTNGRQFLFLAGTETGVGAIDRLVCSLDELVDHEESIEYFTRAAVGQRLDPTSRQAIARQFALERPQLVDEIVATLTDATGEAASAAALETATARFVDQLLVSFGSDDGLQLPADAGDVHEDVSLQFTESTADKTTGAGGATAEDEGEGRGSDTEPASASEAEPNTETESAVDPDEGVDQDGPVGGDGTHRTAETPTSEGATDADDSADSTVDTDDDAATDPYVVRFFNDRGSIGAIGHSQSHEALVQATEYLFERGLSGISVPWSPADVDSEQSVDTEHASSGVDGDSTNSSPPSTTILNDTPHAADGTPMAKPRQLSNGLYLETAGTLDVHGTRVEALTKRAGLRAMLTGAWNDE